METYLRIIAKRGYTREFYGAFTSEPYKQLTGEEIEYILTCIKSNKKVEARFVGFEIHEASSGGSDMIHVDSPARLIINMDNSASPQEHISFVAASIMQEIAQKKELSSQELFVLVQSKVPASMENLTSALKELAPLSNQANLSAGAISTAIAQAKEKYNLSDEETQILWLALTGPGQGVGRKIKLADEKEVRDVFKSYENIQKAENAGLLDASIPRWKILKTMRQWGPHEDTVAVHTLGVLEILSQDKALENFKNPEDIFIMAFFHDFGKRFYNPAYKDERDDHNIESARLVYDTLLSFGFSEDYAKKIERYVKYHHLMGQLIYEGGIEANITDISKEETVATFLDELTERDVDIFTMFFRADMEQAFGKTEFPESNRDSILSVSRQLKEMVREIAQTEGDTRKGRISQSIAILKQLSQARLPWKEELLYYSSPGVLKDYWAIVREFPIVLKLKEKPNKAAGNEFVHVELVIEGINRLLAEDYDYLLSKTTNGTSITGEKIEEFKNTMSKLRIQVKRIVGRDDEKRLILSLMPMVHDIGKVDGLEGHWTRGAELIDTEVFQKIENAGYAIPERIKKTLTLLVEHHFSMGEIYMAANLPDRKEEDIKKAIVYIDSLLADVDKEKQDFSFIMTLLMANTLGDVAQGFLPAEVFIRQFGEVIKYNDREYFLSIREILEAKLEPAKENIPVATGQARELFEIVESSLNNDRTQYIDNGNKLILSVADAKGLEAVASIGSINEKLPSAEVIQRVERAISIIEGLKKDKVSPEAMSSIELLKKNLDQFEADGGVAALIVLARRAKRENQKLLLGLETDWIPAINVKGSLQRNAISALMKEIDAIGEALESMGLDNVEIIRGKGDELAALLLDRADKTHTSLHNIVAMASVNTINSKGFEPLKNANENDRPFLAGIDPAELIKFYNEFGEASSKQLYIKLTQMLYMTLELAAGKEPPQLAIIVSYDKKMRIVIFMPPAELKDYEVIKNNYAGEKKALLAA